MSCHLFFPNAQAALWEIYFFPVTASLMEHQHTKIEILSSFWFFLSIGVCVSVCVSVRVCLDPWQFTAGIHPSPTWSRRSFPQIIRRSLVAHGIVMQ